MPQRRALGVLGEHRGDVVVDGVHADEAVTEAGEPLARQRQGLLVAVQPDDPRPPGSARGSPRRGRPCPACRRRTPRPASCSAGLEEVDDAVAQHGDVPFGGVSSAAHRGPPGRGAVAGAGCGGGGCGCGSTRRLVPIRSGPGAGEVASGAGRLEAGGRVVGRSVVGRVAWGGRRGGGLGSGLRAPGPPPRESTEYDGVGGHDLGEVGVPGGGVPDLEPGAVADDRALLVEVGVGAQRRPGW